MPSKSSKPHHKTDAESNSVNWTPDRKECIIKPRGLNIVWGNDPRCWIVPENQGPAELKQVCWLEVRYSVGVEAGKKYRVSFKVSFKPDAYGWEQAPVFVAARLGKKGKNIWKRVKSINRTYKSEKVTDVPDESDGRLEIVVPSDGSSQDKELHFGLYEVWTNQWKGGLMIHEAMVQQVA